MAFCFFSSCDSSKTPQAAEKLSFSRFLHISHIYTAKVIVPFEAREFNSQITRRSPCMKKNCKAPSAMAAKEEVGKNSGFPFGWKPPLTSLPVHHWKKTSDMHSQHPYGKCTSKCIKGKQYQQSTMEVYLAFSLQVVIVSTNNQLTFPIVLSLACWKPCAAFHTSLVFILLKAGVQCSGQCCHITAKRLFNSWPGACLHVVCLLGFLKDFSAS